MMRIPSRQETCPDKHVIDLLTDMMIGVDAPGSIDALSRAQGRIRQRMHDLICARMAAADPQEGPAMRQMIRCDDAPVTALETPGEAEHRQGRERHAQQMIRGAS